jgi:hypothetical protein
MSFTPPIAKARHIVRKIIRGPKLPLALTGAIMLSLALTVVSVAWYSIDGSSKLDLSRPGYEAERTEVRTTDTQKTYSMTNPVTKSAIDNFLTEYDGRTKELSGYGSFMDSALDDNDIQLNVQSGNGSSTQ